MGWDRVILMDIMGVAARVVSRGILYKDSKKLKIRMDP